MSSVKPPSTTTCVYYIYFFLKLKKVKFSHFSNFNFRMIIFFEGVIHLDSLVVSEADHEQKLWEIAPRKKIKWNWDFQKLKRTNQFLGKENFTLDCRGRVHVTSVAEILKSRNWTIWINYEKNLDLWKPPPVSCETSLHHNLCVLFLLFLKT